jgi:hypothetical protein
VESKDINGLHLFFIEVREKSSKLLALVILVFRIDVHADFLF